ncbi:unnamed protein product [Staurois parvus]|uniref:Uncharacterized protein n=1 Tax=Staurois parvus TaxID=386267 RepID=A0ABN9B154_9NEOB|nr:unnamed protein product [Staurois parvus]
MCRLATAFLSMVDGLLTAKEAENQRRQDQTAFLHNAED